MRWRRARSFRRSLILNLLMTVLVFGAVMAGISYAAIRLSAQRASYAMMTEVVDAVAAETQTFYRSVESIFILVDFWARHNWNGDWNPADLDKPFVPLLLAFYEASTLYLVEEPGHFYMLSHQDGRWVSWTASPEASGGRALLRTWSDADPTPKQTWGPLDFDPMSLPWFQDALAQYQVAGDDAPLHRRVSIADARIAPATGMPGQVVSMASRSPLGGRFVFALERSLTGLTTRLAGVSLLDGGRVATLSGDPTGPSGLVLTGVPLSGAATSLEAAKSLILARPGRLGGPIATFVEAPLAEHHMLPDEPVRFDSDGEVWWGMAKRVESQAFDVSIHSDWVVAVVPEADLLRQLPNLGLALLAATTIALLLAALRARSLARSYSGPIDELVDHSRRMQRLDFERPAQVDTDIVEIGILGGTLESMRRALHSYASISEETRIAEAIVRAMLPATLHRPEGYEIEALWHPAEETGGELLDVVIEADRTALLLLDPDTFGVEAAVLSAQLRAVFRTAIRSGASLGETASQLTRCLEDDLREAGLVRAWLGTLDPASGEVRWIAAGLNNNVLHVCGRDGSLSLHESGDPALGASYPPDLQAKLLRLEPGDILSVVSNGIIDALDRERRRFGTQRLQELLVHQAGDDAAKLVHAIDDAVAAFSAGTRASSDRTVLLVKRRPGGQIA